jgi:hypothetical protein
MDTISDREASYRELLRANLQATAALYLSIKDERETARRIELSQGLNKLFDALREMNAKSGIPEKRREEIRKEVRKELRIELVTPQGKEEG